MDAVFQKIAHETGAQQRAQITPHLHGAHHVGARRHIDRNVGDAGAHPGGAHIAPGDEHCIARPLAKIHLARACRRRHDLEDAIFAHHAHNARGHGLNGSGCCPARDAGHAAKRKRKALRIRQPPLEVRGHAIGGDNVKARARQHHNARRHERIGLGGKRLENRNLAGNVGVVHTFAQTGFNHGLCRMHEGAGAVEHQRYTLQRSIERVRVIQFKDAVGKVEGVGLDDDVGGTAPCENGLEAAVGGGARNQRTGVAIRAVDQKCAHRAGVVLSISSAQAQQKAEPS